VENGGELTVVELCAVALLDDEALLVEHGREVEQLGEQLADAHQLVADHRHPLDDERARHCVLLEQR